jgi:hypothetical protein
VNDEIEVQQDAEIQYCHIVYYLPSCSATKIVYIKYTYILQHVSALSGHRQVIYLYIHPSTFIHISPCTGQCVTYGTGCIVLLYRLSLPKTRALSRSQILILQKMKSVYYLQKKRSHGN